jgi:hypothetical protein
VCPGLGRILNGLTSLVNILEVEYGGRVDRRCNLYKSRLESVKEKITIV